MDRDAIRALERTYDGLLQEQLPEVVSYVAEHAALFERHGIDPAEFRLPLRPMFYSRAELLRLEAGVRALWAGLLDVYAHVFSGDPDKAAAFLGTPTPFLPWLRKSLDRERCVDELFGRPDGFAWGNQLQLIEQNVTSGAGGMAGTEALADFFDGFPALVGLRRHARVERLSLLDAYAGYFQREHGGHTVGYIDAFSPETGAPSDTEGLLFVEGLRARGIDLRHLTYPKAVFGVDGATLDGARIDCFYRGEAAIALLEYLDSVTPYLDACDRGIARMVASLHEIVLFDKQLLPFLSDDEQNGFLSDERRAAIAAVLPWTRLLRDRATRFHGRAVRVPALCLERQHDLVIKKGDGCCSNAVAIGAEHDADTWRRLVGQGIEAGNWVVQEMVVPPAESLPYLDGAALTRAEVVSMTCPYLVRGRVAAVGGRTSVPQGSRILVGAGAKGFQAGIRTAFCVE